MRAVPASLLVTVALSAVAPGLARGHSFKRSLSDLRVEDGPDRFGVNVIFDVDPDDFEDTLFARFDRNRSGRIEIDELQRHQDVLGNLTRAGLLIERGGEACPGELLDTQVSVAAQLLRAHLYYACPSGGPLRVEVPLLERTRRNHIHFLVVRQATGARTATLTAENRVWEDPEADLLALLGRFTRVGIQHIVIGYDHLLFLLALLVVARRLGEMVKIITAFTVAHSITLVVAGLGVIVLPDVVVEAAIALSIVVVGLLNLRGAEGATGRRWLLTFALGLVHGFGFAAVLGELHLPAHSQVPPLLAFNLGVEIGQLGVVLAVVPALAALRRDAAISRRAQIAIAVGAALGGAALLPFEIICAVGLWVLAAAALLLTPRFGYQRAVVRGGSWMVIGLGGMWFLLRVGAGLIAP